MKIDLTRVITLDLLIRQKSTGTPEALAERLGVSRRTLFFTLNFMRDYMDAPIAYNRFRETYFYSEEGLFLFAYKKYNDALIKEILKRSIRGSLILTLFLNIEFSQVMDYFSSLI